MELSTLYPYLRMELPGIIEPALADGALGATQDFLARSEVWKHTTPSLLPWETARVFPVLVENTDIPEGTRVTRVDEVKYAPDGTSLRKVPFATRSQLDDMLSNWEVKTGSCPLRWTYDGPGSPRIVPIAEEDVLGSIQLRLVLSLTDGATSVPDFLFYEFKEAIKHGALARLMKVPGKDWTNMSASSTYASMFERDIDEAKSRAQAEFGQPAREVQYGGI